MFRTLRPGDINREGASLEGFPKLPIEPAVKILPFHQEKLQGQACIEILLKKVFHASTGSA